MVPKTQHRPVWAALGVLVAAVVIAGLFVGSVAGQAGNTTVEPMYNTTPSGIVDNGTWMEGREEADVHNTSSFVAGLPGFIIGSGSGPQGSIPTALLSGLLVFGAVLSITGRSQVGVVAGGVIGVSTAATLIEINLAPEWTYLVILTPIAILIAMAYLRVVN